jgi:SAM-dependent methyltransferase
MMRSPPSDPAAAPQGLYAKKPDGYFGHARQDILPLVPRFAETVLEVGCGEGATLNWLRSLGRCRRTIGVELSPSAGARAAQHVDLVIRGGVEGRTLPIDPGSVDLLLLLDVLEHLVDPWNTLRSLVSLLSPGGTVVASIPNINHVSAVMPLVLRGRWDYEDEGILDRSHLRFFVRSTAEELLRSANLTITKVAMNGVAWGSKGGLFDRLTLGLCRRFFVEQYLIQATRTTTPARP